MRFGFEKMTDGQRRAALTERFDRVMSRFAGRILPFTTAAAVPFARIVAHRRRIGEPIELPDALIAATALAHEMAIATRDLGGFRHTGLTVIDPWREA